jgi:hypothetical protein
MSAGKKAKAGTRFCTVFIVAARTLRPRGASWRTLGQQFESSPATPVCQLTLPPFRVCENRVVPTGLGYNSHFTQHSASLRAGLEYSAPAALDFLPADVPPRKSQARSYTLSSDTRVSYTPGFSIQNSSNSSHKCLELVSKIIFGRFEACKLLKHIGSREPS